MPAGQPVIRKPPSPPRGARSRARATVQALAETYPAACALIHEGPLQLLVATILSAQTTDQRVNQVTPALFSRLRTAADYGSVDPAELEQLIHATGFFRAKSRALIGMGRYLEEHFGGMVPDSMEQLVRLPGVGRKTANVVLGVGFGKPGFPVDTHVNRLSNRLGLTGSQNPVVIEQQVCSLVPRREWTGLSLRLILHGRKVCLARGPRCSICVLESWCPSSSLRRPARGASGTAGTGAPGRRPNPRGHPRSP